MIDLLCGLCINVISLIVLIELLVDYGDFMFGMEVVLVVWVVFVY